LRVYEDPDYKGSKYTVVKTSECLADGDKTFKLLNKNKTVRQRSLLYVNLKSSDKKSHLRKHKAL